MFAFIACVIFVLAFVLVGAAVAVTTAWLSWPALIALGLAFLAADHFKDRLPPRR